MRGVVLGAVTSALISVAAAQPAPDVDRAKELYNAAEAAMKEGHYADAVRDYGESYELSKQPALFYKIARANEKAGKCDVALIYYARYLREGKPSESFVATTKERISACGGDPEKLSSIAPTPPHEPPHPPLRPLHEPADSGSGSGSGSADKTDVGHSVLGGSTQSGTGSGSGSDTPLRPPSTGHKAAWLLVGTSIGMATIGGVLAYATSSSENDVKDLYVSALGQPPQFDVTTQKHYNDLIDEGHTYEKLSWVSFGLAGVAAIGAAVLFATGGDDDGHAEHATLLVSPTSAGVRVQF